MNRHLQTIVIISMFLITVRVNAHLEVLVETFQKEDEQHQSETKRQGVNIQRTTQERVGKPLWKIDAKVPFVGSPVHEKMTIQSINLSKVHQRYYKIDYDEAYIHGVFWNDDPNNMLCPECSSLNPVKFLKRWGVAFSTNFLNAQELARHHTDATTPAFGPGDGLLARSHFGDLQFLHAMASMDGELAKDTQLKILLWIEFAYKVAVGKIDTGTKLQEIPIKGIPELFPGKMKKKAVHELFISPVFAKRVAMGTVLHIIQDSYAPGHADREIRDGKKNNVSYFNRGGIREFHSYVNQDSDLHAEDDNWPENLNYDNLNGTGNPISVGASFLTFVYSNEGEGADWNIVKKFFITNVFYLLDIKAAAGPGEKYHETSSQ